MTQASSTDKRREVVRVELCVYRCKQTQQADGEWVDDDTDITADIVLDNTIVTEWDSRIQWNSDYPMTGTEVRTNEQPYPEAEQAIQAYADWVVNRTDGHPWEDKLRRESEDEDAG